MCSPIHCAGSVIINFVPVCIVFASLKLSCFQTWEGARATLLLASSPGGLVARFPGFHSGFPDSVPGEETKISLQDHSL